MRLNYSYEFNVNVDKPRWEFSIGYEHEGINRASRNYIPEYMSAEDILKAFEKVIRGINEDLEKYDL